MQLSVWVVLVSGFVLSGTDPDNPYVLLSSDFTDDSHTDAVMLTLHAVMICCRARFPSANNSGNASMYYSTNVGPAHFLMLNSYISYSSSSAQYAFVEKDLAAYAAANPRAADGTTTGLTP